MRAVKQFVTENPRQLSTQLSQLEQNVATEADDIRATYDVTPVPTSPVTRGGGVYTTGQALIADTNGGSFSVNLAAPVNGRPGRMIVINLSANVLSLVPRAPALLNLSTLAFPAPGGITQLFFDGTNWWAA